MEPHFEQTDQFNNAGILSLYSSSSDWQVTQNLLQDLTKIANQSIFDSVAEKEALFKQFLNTIYSGHFDELDGGLLVCKDELYYKPVSINLSICRLLLASDLVFYHGEFRNVAINILSNIINSVTHSQSCILSQDKYFKIDQLNCCFDSATLKSILDENEFNLLLALSGSNLMVRQLIYTKKKPLKKASEIIEMHYKEAQIIENSIHLKLSNYAENKKVARVYSQKQLLDEFQINCELVEIVCEHLYISENSEQRNFANHLFNELDQVLTLNEKNNHSFDKHVTNFISAGICLLTIDFKLELLAKVINLISQSSGINNTKEINNDLTNINKQDYQRTFIIAFLQSLPKKFRLPNELEKIRNTQNNRNNLFTFVFIDQQTSDWYQQTTTLNSKYNTFQKVFSY